MSTPPRVRGSSPTSRRRRRTCAPTSPSNSASPTGGRPGRHPMRDVVIVGADMTPFGKHRDRTLTGLGGDAVRGAILDAGAAPADIQAIYSGNVAGGSLTGQRM